MSHAPEIRVQRMRPLPPKRPVIVSVLDVGTSKICCIIARLTPRPIGDVLPGRTHFIEVLGFGYQRFQSDVMFVTVTILLILVQLLQVFGDRLVQRFVRS